VVVEGKEKVVKRLAYLDPLCDLDIHYPSPRYEEDGTISVWVRLSWRPEEGSLAAKIGDVHRALQRLAEED
jgi:hypothetical protein